MPEFAETIATAYSVEGLAIDLGRGVHEGAVAPEAVVRVPLAMMNRHGLVAGATGTPGQLIVSETVFALIYSFAWDGRWPSGAQLTACVLFTLGILFSIKAHR